MFWCHVVLLVRSPFIVFVIQMENLQTSQFKGASTIYREKKLDVKPKNITTFRFHLRV